MPNREIIRIDANFSSGDCNILVLHTGKVEHLPVTTGHPNIFVEICIPIMYIEKMVELVWNFKGWRFEQ